MHYAWICGDYAALGYYASIFSDCVSVLFLCLCLGEYPTHFILFFPLSLIFYLILFSLFSQLPSLLHSLLFFFTLSSSPPPSSSSSPRLLLRASGCFPRSDVLLARWCMHISCVFLMLTRVDICTALWDSALGHISCNDENDDGDEESGRRRGGGCFYFLPLSFL